MNNFIPGTTKKSTAKAFGTKLKDYAKHHSSFYFVSPDETPSNKLDEIFKVTSRAWSNLSQR